MKTIALIPVVLLVVGCSTPPEVARSVAEANAKLAGVPTLSGKCSAGCEFTYTDPRDKTRVAMPTNGWDFAKSLVGSGERTLMSIAPWATTGLIVKEAIKNSGHNTTYTNSGEGASQGYGTASVDRSRVDNGIDSHDVITDNTNNTNNSNQNNRTADPTVVNPVVVSPQVVNPVVVNPVVVGP